MWGLGWFVASQPVGGSCDGSGAAAASVGGNLSVAGYLSQSKTQTNEF